MDNAKTKIAAVITAVFSMFSLQSCGNVVQKVNTEQSVSAFAPESSTEPTTDAAVTTTAAETVTTTTTTTVPAVMRGKLFDANGELLMYSQRDSNGKEQRMTNDSNKVAFANVLNEMSEGLDKTFNDELRKPNPSPVEGQDDVGQSIQLTFDAAKQNAVYDYMASSNIVGSAVPRVRTRPTRPISRAAIRRSSITSWAGTTTCSPASRSPIAT